MQSPGRGRLCADGEGSCGHGAATPEAARLLGTFCEWMTVLISLPNRGGIQPALLQTNFANHILWLKIGLLRPLHLGGQTSLVEGGALAEVGQLQNDSFSFN